MTFSAIQVILQGLVQGAAELLPISELSPRDLHATYPWFRSIGTQQTLLLVMLHTGTMLAVISRYGRAWMRMSWSWRAIRPLMYATAVTGFLGLALKAFIEKLVLISWVGLTHEEAEVEWLFKSQKLLAMALFATGVVLLSTYFFESKSSRQIINKISIRAAVIIGAVQAFCLPFRGFSRSGATISMALGLGISRRPAERFSFALAILLTPPVLLKEMYRFYKSNSAIDWSEMLTYGTLGMVTAFCSGWIAIRIVGRVLDSGRWWIFGIYAWVFALVTWYSNFN